MLLRLANASWWLIFISFLSPQLDDVSRVSANGVRLPQRVPMARTLRSWKLSNNLSQLLLTWRNCRKRLGVCKGGIALQQWKVVVMATQYLKIIKTGPLFCSNIFFAFCKRRYLQGQFWSYFADSPKLECFVYTFYQCSHMGTFRSVFKSFYLWLFGIKPKLTLTSSGGAKSLPKPTYLFVSS